MHVKKSEKGNLNSKWEKPKFIIITFYYYYYYLINHLIQVETKFNIFIHYLFDIKETQLMDIMQMHEKRKIYTYKGKTTTYKC